MLQTIKYIVQREDGLFYWKGWSSSQHGWEKSFDKAYLFNRITSATTRAKKLSHLYNTKVKSVVITLEKENYE